MSKGKERRGGEERSVSAMEVYLHVDSFPGESRAPQEPGNETNLHDVAGPQFRLLRRVREDEGLVPEALGKGSWEKRGGVHGDCGQCWAGGTGLQW